MYLFFDSGGTLREQITTSPVRVGDGDVNKIYVYWDTQNTVSDGYCIYRKPDGTNTEMIYKTKFTTGTESIIPYDQNRDLKYFKYNTPYRFCVFDIPEEVFGESGSVLFSCWLIYNTNLIKTMSLATFGVEASTLSVAPDQNINIAQWNMLIDLILGTAEYNNINVQNITFKNSNEPTQNGLSVKDNVIYWCGDEIITLSDLITYVNTTEPQNISGYKTFLGGIGIENAPLDIENLSNIPIIAATINDDDNTTDYKIIADEGTNDATYNIKLPNKSGRLAIDSDVVHNSGDENINGQKTFKEKIIIDGVPNAPIMQFDILDSATGNQSTFNVYANSPIEDGKEYSIELPKSNGVLLNDKALTPTILTPATATSRTIELPGGEATALTSGGAGTYTVAVLPDATIIASISSGAITNIDQQTGVISFVSPEENPTISWHYEATRVTFRFSIGDDYNGIYVFTHSYLTMLIPIYQLTQNVIYKFTGAGLQNAQGSVINLVHNMRRSGNDLDIWSGNTDYPMLAGRIGILAKVKLY